MGIDSREDLIQTIYRMTDVVMRQVTTFISAGLRYLSPMARIYRAVWRAGA